MKHLLEPFVRLVGSLSYRHKLVATAMVFGFPLLLSFSLIINELHQRESALRLERDALSLQLPALRILTGLHQLTTDTAERPQHHRQTIEAALDEIAQRPADELAPLQTWIATWRQQAGQIGDPSGLIRELRSSLDRVNEKSRLSLDGEPGANRLIDILTRKLPTLIDNTGKAARLGAEALTQQRLKSKSRNELTMIRGSYDPLVSWSIENLERAAEHHAAHQTTLVNLSGQLNSAFLNVQEALTIKIIDTTDYDMPAADYLGRSEAATQEALKVAAGLTQVIDQLFADRAESLAGQRNFILILISMVLIGILIGFFSAYMSIMRGLRSVSASATAMANGDLRARVNINSNDELGQVGQHFNRMGDAFSNLIHDTMAAATEVKQAAGGMHESTGMITRSSEQQSAASERVAAAIEELTVSIGEVAEHAVATASITRQAAAAASQEEERARTAINEMQLIVERVDQAIDSIRNLETRSREISKIVQVIQEIADQTNLLALNAAIEAARAGEAGRGFSVVADEVRNLADRTGASTREIDLMVRSIQGDIHDVVLSMDSSGQDIGQSAQMIKELAQALVELRQAVDASAHHVADIVNATVHERSASTEIAQNVQGIAEMADRNHAELKTSAASTAHLKQLAERLTQSIVGLRIA